MTNAQLLAAVTEFYLGSGDFNGIPLRTIPVARPELDTMISELVTDDLVSLNFGSPHPNPHIKAFPPEAAEKQLERLAGTADLTHVTAYPERKHLETVVDAGKYSNEPYTLRMALGAGALEPAFFDLAVLEIYRNDPRYLYRSDDTQGLISVSDEYFRSDAMRGSDQVLLQTFGYGFDEDMYRSVCVYFTYLRRLSPEHQQIWASKELEGSFRIHPAYWASTAGHWPERVSIFRAFSEELHQLQQMCDHIGEPRIVREDFSDDRKPPNFGFLIRPTLRELQDFYATLDKMMSDNLNKDFLRKYVPETETETTRKDGKVVVQPKGTITLLAEMMDKMTFPNREPADRMIEIFRRVRKLRQRPAHAADDNKFDLEYYREQRELVIEAYTAVRTLRMIIANHPGLRDYDGVPEWLHNGEIYNY